MWDSENKSGENDWLNKGQFVFLLQYQQRVTRRHNLRTKDVPELLQKTDFQSCFRWQVCSKGRILREINARVSFTSICF